MSNTNQPQEYDQPVDDLVICHSGSEYAERPVKFYWDGSWVNISSIINEWRIPEGKIFQVVSERGKHFILMYNQIVDHWTIESN